MVQVGVEDSRHWVCEQNVQWTAISALDHEASRAIVPVMLNSCAELTAEGRKSDLVFVDGGVTGGVLMPERILKRTRWIVGLPIFMLAGLGQSQFAQSTLPAKNSSCTVQSGYKAYQQTLLYLCKVGRM